MNLIVFYVMGSLATVTMLLPFLAGWGRRTELSRAQHLFLLYVSIEFVLQLGSFVLGRLALNNHWLAYLVTPVETAVILATFSLWQIDEGMRRALRIAAPLMLLFWVPPLLRWEPSTSFSIGIDSIQAILCLAAAAYTVVRRSMDTAEQAQTQDWFLIGAGVMLSFATFALMGPLSSYLVKRSVETAYAVLSVQAGAQLLANVLYYHGMRCPLNPQRSGLSIFPPSWWGRFSWSRSGPR